MLKRFWRVLSSPQIKRLLMLFLVLMSVYFVFQALRQLPSVKVLHGSYPVLKYVYSPGARYPQKIEVKFLQQRPKSWISLSSVPRHTLGAIITSEDWAFYQHNGFDLKQVSEAIQESLKDGEWGRGASTITQQLAKNVFLSQERSLQRKLMEAFVTWQIESQFDKKKILEIYLNVIEWGPGVVGLQQASQYYFQKSVLDLNVRESAFLAFLIPSPVRYSSSFRKKALTPFAQAQMERILGRLNQAGYISLEEMDEALRSKLSFEQSFEAVESGEESEADL